MTLNGLTPNIGNGNDSPKLPGSYLLSQYDDFKVLIILSYLERDKDVHQYRHEAPEQPVDQCNLA